MEYLKYRKYVRLFSLLPDMQAGSHTKAEMEFMMIIHPQAQFTCFAPRQKVTSNSKILRKNVTRNRKILCHDIPHLI